MNISWLEIKERCQLAISEANRRGDIDSFLFFTLLSQTGLRGDECLITANWILTQDERVLIPQHKRGNPKMISIYTIPKPVLDTMQRGETWKFLGSLSTYQRTFVRYGGLQNCFVGGKRIKLHAFRHVFIKSKVDEGMGISEINALLGIRRSATTLGYIMKKYNTESYDPNELSNLL